MPWKPTQYQAIWKVYHGLNGLEHALNLVWVMTSPTGIALVIFFERNGMADRLYTEKFRVGEST